MQQASVDDTVRNSILSKMTFNLKRLFVDSWCGFSRLHKLTSNNTCLFGHHVATGLNAAYNMEQFKKISTGDSDMFPSDCFVDSDTYIDVFFDNVDMRTLFVAEHLCRIFKVKSINLEQLEHKQWPLDVTTLQLSSNLPTMGLYSVIVVNLVCTTKRSKLIALTDVNSLMMGPDTKYTIDIFDRMLTPYSNDKKTTRPFVSTVSINQIFHNIIHKIAVLYILPQHIFLSENKTMIDEESYSSYWHACLQRGWSMIKEGWKFKNLVHSSMLNLCECDKKSRKWDYINYITEQNELMIAHLCVSCNESCTVFTLTV